MKFTTTPTEWVYENEHLRCGNKYLDMKRGWVYSLKISDKPGNVTFDIENGKILAKYNGAIIGSDYASYVTMSSDMSAELEDNVS